MAKKIFLYLFLVVLLFSVTILPSASASEEVEYVYLGGRPIGIVMDGDGLEICGKSEVITDKGAQIPALNLEILPGDILIGINGQKVSTLKELSSILKNIEDGKEIKIEISRNGKILTFDIIPAKESLSGNKKLGLVIKDGTSGIGTVTYVRKDLTFGALGHTISDTVKVQQGKIFECKINGVNYPKSNQAGELKGSFDKNKKMIGKVTKNNQFGVFGIVQKNYGYAPEVRLGNKSLVQEGKAYIYTCVDGCIPQKYEIEIVKAYNQSEPEVKSMVIKVTDKNLLEKSGGIVQGMSGSPIVQNGYLVGAVTHVFTSDSTKGYGLYIDWMINN